MSVFTVHCPNCTVVTFTRLLRPTETATALVVADT